MTPLDPAERLFSISDIVRLFSRSKWILLKIALVTGSLCALYFLFRPSAYKIKATFKECSEQKEADGVLKDLLGGFNSGQGPQVAVLMKSNQVVKPLVERLGLQATVGSSGRLKTYWNELGDTICAELGNPLPKIDSFRFRDVIYEEEKPFSCQMIWSDSKHFTIISQRKKITGCVGEKVEVGTASFRIVHVPSHLKIGTVYPLSISPWIDVVKGLSSRLQIENNKINKSIYDLAFRDRDRFLGTETLNEWMAQYQQYLKRDHDQIADSQLAYLELRQNELLNRLGLAFDEHTRFMRENVGEHGFVNSEQEIKAFLMPYQNLFERSFAADVELDHISAWREHPTAVLFWENTPLGLSIHKMRDKIQKLESYRDALAASLYFHPNRPDVAESGPALGEELQLVRSDLDQAQLALAAIEKDGELAFNFELHFDPHHALKDWAQGVKNKEDLAQYLRNIIRLFSLQEKILQERQVHLQVGRNDLAGLDLATSQQLILQASQKLDESLAKKEQYRSLIQRIDDPAFEVSSLSTVLIDPVSQGVLKLASRLHFEMQDEESYSEKERSRDQREMDLQRKMLKNHLNQMIDVEEITSSFLQDKTASLQQISLDCINRQVSSDQEQMAGMIRERNQSLIREKQLLEKKMRDLRHDMNDLPEKWRAENLLKFKTELGIKIMQSIAQLVESKTIGQNLHHIGSKPLDIAIAPVVPENPRVRLFSLAAAIMAAMMGFFGLFLRGLYRGFPVTDETLIYLRYPYSGPLSFHSDGPNVGHLPDQDLESLRKLMLRIDEEPRAKVIALIEGRGPDYSHALAGQLAKSGRKVLHLSCSFNQKFSDQDAVGLQQILAEKMPTLPVRRLNGYDVLSSGGYTRFGLELIHSPAFTSLLEQSKTAYDHILLVNRSSLSSAESEALLTLSDKAAVSVTEETIELLTPFAQWAYHDGRCRLTFLAAHQRS